MLRVVPKLQVLHFAVIHLFIDIFTFDNMDVQENCDACHSQSNSHIKSKGVTISFCKTCDTYSICPSISCTMKVFEINFFICIQQLLYRNSLYLFLFDYLKFNRYYFYDRCVVHCHNLLWRSVPCCVLVVPIRFMMLVLSGSGTCVGQ